MFRRIALLAILLSPSFGTVAGGLVAVVAPCDRAVNFSAGADIATAVARSLLGTAIDTIVGYLNDPKMATFEVIVPVMSMEGLIDAKKCLYVSSSTTALPNANGEFAPALPPETATRAVRAASPEPKPFLAVITFERGLAGGPDKPDVLRPQLLRWTYNQFLGDECRLFRNCKKRDVAFSIGVMPPAATIAGRTVASEPFGFAVTNADVNDVQSAVATSAALPWFLLANSKSPANLKVTLVETSQPNAFTKALAAAIAAKKTEIQDTVENRLKGISDTVAAEAAQKDVVAASTAFEAYKKAFDAASVTKFAYEGTADVTQKAYLKSQYQIQRQAALLAHLLADAAFKTAGLGALPALGDLPAV